MILDIIFVAVMLLALFTGVKQGLVKSVWKIGAWAITAIAVAVALTPTVNFLHGTKMANRIYTSISQAATEKFANTGNVSLSEMTSLPEWMVSGADESLRNVQDAANEGLNAAAETTARTITDAVIRIIAVVGLFLLIRIALSILFIVVNGASKLPVVNGVNKLLGAVFSACNVLLGVYLVLALISLFANPAIYESINQTWIVKNLFNHNILMQLFMRI